MSKSQILSFDDEQLGLTEHCIESLLVGDDLLGDMLDDEFNFDFVEDGFPTELSDEESQSNHSSSVDDVFFTADFQEVHSNLPEAFRVVSPEPTTPTTTQEVSMRKLAECMERTALSRSLVEKFCKTSLKRKLRRTSSMKERVQLRRRSLLLAKSLKEQGLEPRNALKLATSAYNIVRVDSSIGSFLRKQKTNSISKLTDIQNVNFRSSGLKISKKKLEFLNSKLVPLNRSKSSFPLPKEKGGILSVLRKQQLDASILEL